MSDSIKSSDTHSGGPQFKSRSLKIYNVRLQLVDGKFIFPVGGFMHRFSANKNGGGQWIEASDIDQEKLKEQLSK